MSSVLNEIIPGLCRYVAAHRYRDADDRVQDGMLRAVEVAHEGRYIMLSRSRQVALLGRTAINAAISGQRRQNAYSDRARKWTARPGKAVMPQEIIFDLTETLSPKDQKILRLRYFGYNGNEIAKLLSVSKATISRSMSRIRDAYTTGSGIKPNIYHQ